MSEPGRIIPGAELPAMSAREVDFAVVGSGAGGVRNEDVQLTVVPPPTLRPCRIMIARSSVARLPCSW